MSGTAFFTSPEPVGNDQARRESFARFGVSTGMVAGAAAAQTFQENYAVRAWRDFHEFDLKTGGDESPYLSEQVANEKYGLNGLVKFKGPVKESVARLKSEHAQDRADREEVLSRGRGFIQSSASMTAMLGTSLLDPVNLGMAFIPVVGEARYAQLLGAFAKGALTANRVATLVKVAETGNAAEKVLALRMLEGGAGVVGRAGARALTGAGNAGVGNVGIGYLNSLYEGTGYYIDDAGRDVAFGAVLGAGLHVIPGAVGDHFRGLHRNTPPLMGRTAIADLARGEEVRSPGMLAELDAKRAYELARKDPAIVGRFGEAPKVYEPGAFDFRKVAPEQHNLPRLEYVKARVNEPMPEALTGLNLGDRKFADNLDRAAFIATGNLPKQAAEALRWTQERFGLTDAEVLARGKVLRQAFKKKTEAPAWAEAGQRLDAAREREIEQALIQGQFVVPDRLTEFPALSKGYASALPTLETAMAERVARAGKEFGAAENAKAMVISKLNAEREAAILARRDAILSEQGQKFSERLGTEPPRRFDDPTPEEHATRNPELEKQAKQPLPTPEENLQRLEEQVKTDMQDAAYVLDEDAALQESLKELSGQIGEVKSLGSKLKDLASCVWSSL